MSVAYKGGLTLWSALRRAWSEYERDFAGFLASAMVYYALVSLVPLLLLLMSALGLALRFSDVAAAAQQQVLSTVEAKFGPGLPATIETLLNHLQQDSIVATVVGFIGVLATASVLFRQLRLSFRAIWKYVPPMMAGSVRLVVQSTFVEQAMSLAMVLLGGVLLLVVLGLLAVLQWLSGLLDHLPVLRDTPTWLMVLPGPVIIVTLTFAFLFKFLPPVQLKWRHVWLASVLCAVAWLVASEILALYGTYFGRHASTYGAIGGLLAIMLWMNVVSKLLFFGAELCKVVAQHDLSSSGEPVT